MKQSRLSKIFNILNSSFLLLVGIICLLPFIHIIAVSFSSSAPAAAGYVKFWPVEFTLKSYEYIFERPQFLRAMMISFNRVLLAVPIQMILTLMVAYPLSKDSNRFKSRSFYVWFFLITMLFNGGLIPTYMIVNETGLINTIWALVIPGSVPVFNILLLLNFFRELPSELSEAALIDGAGHWRILWRIYLPLSKPAIATLVLFVIVNHWNSWLDGIIYINNPNNYPLQSYLRNLVVTISGQTLSRKDIERLAVVSERTSKCAQLFIAAVPILCTYPFLQKYFAKGLVLGSVKG